MSEKTRTHVDLFWTLVDEILNAVLFMMIGLVLLIVPISGRSSQSRCSRSRSCWHPDSSR